LRKKIINFPLLEGKIWSFVLGMSFSSPRPEKQAQGLVPIVWYILLHLSP